MIKLKTNDRMKDGVIVTLCHGDAVDTVTYKSDAVMLTARPECAIAGLLLIAMADGEDFKIDARLDSVFYDNLTTIQDVYKTWAPNLSRVEIITEENEGRLEHGALAQRKDGKIATFFSGGVDSFYTFLKHREEIDALIFVHGFDINIEDTKLRRTVSQRLHAVANAYGKKFIEVETTLRDITERERMTSKFYNWEISHGSALASVAYTLTGAFDRIYIPATHTYDIIKPWGSHPLLDPLWGSEALSLIYDGGEADRLQKCEFIARNDIALQNLRVCWKNQSDQYNCGRCEKCKRTMLMLKAIGVLDKCTTFQPKLSTRDIASIWIREKGKEMYYNNLIDSIGKDQRQLRYAVKVALYYSKLKRWARSIFQWLLTMMRAVR